MSQKLRQRHSSRKTNVITRVSHLRFHRVKIIRCSNGGFNRGIETGGSNGGFNVSKIETETL